jgi:hypothetical protein
VSIDSRRPSELPASALDELSERVVGARLCFLDPRDVLRARDHDVIRELLRRDATPVIADESDRRHLTPASFRERSQGVTAAAP